MNYESEAVLSASQMSLTKSKIKSEGLDDMQSCTYTRMRRKILKRLRKKNKLIYLLLLIVIIYAFRKFMVRSSIGSTTKQGSPVHLDYVVVHLDLKGAPPTLKYLEFILPELKELGANALLMEYEDMFPYEGKLYNLSSPFHYKKDRLKNFLKHASETGLEIIPLIQTFGHLEFALKLKEFQHLREVPLYPDSICPSKPDTMTLITEMIRQIVRFHQSVAPLKHIHIGCDEVFRINQCDDCKKRLLNTKNIYLNHLFLVAGVVKTMSPNTTVLIWDDMLRTIKPADFVNIGYIENIAPVCWDYNPTRLSNQSHIQIYLYHRSFKNIWIATAYKGADGAEAVTPNLTYRILNHLLWLYFIKDYQIGYEKKTYNFKGIIMTGWSRYTHFDPLCELLPLSLQSLINNLILVKRLTSADAGQYGKSDWYSFYQQFNPESTIDLTSKSTTDLLNIKTLTMINNIQGFTKFVDKYMSRKPLTDFEYVSHFEYTHMETITNEFERCGRAIVMFQHLKTKAVNSMKFFYASNVIDEYIGYKGFAMQKYLSRCIRLLNDSMKVRSWERGRNFSTWNDSLDVITYFSRLADINHARIPNGVGRASGTR